MSENRVRPVIVLPNPVRTLWIRTFSNLLTRVEIIPTNDEMTLSHTWRGMGLTPEEAVEFLVSRRMHPSTRAQRPMRVL